MPNPARLDPPDASTVAGVRWIATCPDETKGVLEEELSALGATQLVPIYRGVAFVANLETGYRAHLWLRTASRIQRLVGDLPGDSAAALTAAAAGVAWPLWLRAQRPFTVTPILTDAEARTLGEDAVIQAVSSSVARAFGDAGAVAPKFDPEADEPVHLMAHVRAGVCTLGLDTAGRALHKRGWRLTGHPAVLKETLAAAVLMLAGYDGAEPLLDPMCGSGTVIIEGAYIALNKAPLIHRGKDDFGFEHQAGFDRALWRRVSDQARAKKKAAPDARLFASDIREAYVELARQTALRARVEKHITFSTTSIQDAVPPAPTGLLVANLPYGERIGRGEVPTLYKDVGQALRGPFALWRSALLVPAEVPRNIFGITPSSEVSLMNGALPVRLMLFPPQR